MVDSKTIKTELLVHDLKVPLAIISAGVSSLLSQPEKYGAVSAKQEKVLKRIQRNTVLTQNLVNDILELGRSREGKVIVCQTTFAELIRQVMIELFDLMDGELAEQIKYNQGLDDFKKTMAGASITIDCDECIWSQVMMLDFDKMLQILRNLISNALKYRKHIIEIKGKRVNELLVIAIKDDGPGIPRQYHRQIFECYFQMAPADHCLVRSHGLGLAGAMILVHDMGGALTLASDENQGAEFEIKLPITFC